MRRWESLVDGFLRECKARGLSEATRRAREAELARMGRWLRRRRPRPTLEQVDTDMVVAYLTSRSAFRSKSTIAGTTSHVRMMGEYLVREGIWKSNPLRWLRGPKMDNRSRLPRRIGKEHLEALWDEAVKKREGFARAQVMADWRRELTVRHGKGDKPRQLPVMEGLWTELMAYLREAADRHPIAALVDTVRELLPDARYRFQTPPVAKTG
jgi:hypothetical protein